MKQRLQRACRSALRPIAGFARRILTPATPPPEFDWHKITGGPAAGAEALLPKGSDIAQAITSGSYEKRIVSIMQALVADGDACWDVGGHYGYYTLALAKLVAEGEIHTFEPVAAHAQRIGQAVERSRLSNVTVHQVAVAAKVGEMTLQFATPSADNPSADDSMAYLSEYGGVDTPAAREHYDRFSRTTVSTVTLDSLMAQLSPPRFIKIDAEGAEAAILAAGSELMSSVRPRLLVELHGIYEALACAEILYRTNYRAILLTDQKITMPILCAPREDDEALRIVCRSLGHDPIVLLDQDR